MVWCLILEISQVLYFQLFILFSHFFFALVLNLYVYYTLRNYLTVLHMYVVFILFLLNFNF